MITSYYIQPMPKKHRPTTAEIIRNILWYATQILACVLAFAVAFAVVILASAI